MSNKSLTKNSIFNIIYKGFTAIFPILTTSYISRVLLPVGVGKVAYASTIVSYFTVFAALGIPNYGVKVIANLSNNKQGRSKCFFELLIINALSTTFCYLIYIIMVNCTGLFLEKKSLMNVMSILLLLNLFNTDWFYQGMEEYSYIATRSIIIKVLSFVAMLFFVKSSTDYLKYAFILCLATAGNYLLNFINIKKYINWRIYDFNFVQHIKPIIILLAASIAAEIYTMLDTIMLEYYDGDITVGYYSNAVKIVRMIYTVTVALVATFYPRISKCYSDRNFKNANILLSVGTKIILLFCIPFVIGLFSTAELIIPILLGNEFKNSIFVLQELSILVAIFSIAYFLGHIVLISTANEKLILKATIAGAVINSILNFVLIPRYSENGAAVASVISEIVVTLILVKNSSRYFKLGIDKKFLISIIIASLFMICNIYFMKEFFTINLFLIIASSGCIYFLLLIIMKNDLVLLLFRKFMNRR